MSEPTSEMRQYAASVLLEAADEQDAESLRLKPNAGSHAGGHQCAADHLRVKASEVLSAVTT